MPNMIGQSSAIIRTLTIKSKSPVPEGNMTLLKLTVILPSGESIDYIPTLDTSRYLSYNLEVSQYGLYIFNWSCKYGNLFFNENSLLAVTYTDIRSSVINMLSLEQEDFSIEKYNLLFPGILLFWLTVLAEPVPSYDSLGNMYGPLFDNAMVAALTCFIRPYLNTSSDILGEISSVGTGPDKIEYHRRYAAITSSAGDDMCLDHIWSILNVIPSISEWNTGYLSTLTTFRTAGRRRALLNDVPKIMTYEIYGDRLTEYLFAGGYLNEFAGWPN